jgi:hypothetical protein
MLLRYCLHDFEMISVSPVIAGVTSVFTFHMRCVAVVKVFISIPRVSSVKTQFIYCQSSDMFFDLRSHHQANYWTMLGEHKVEVHIFGIPKCLQQWETVKNAHFHLTYLIRGSIIGLMMTPWVETCRHFSWQ